MAIHYFMQEKCLQPPLYPPCSMVQACPVRWTKQACAINTVSLYSLETATFLAKVFRILIQVLSDLAASSTKSCTKFCRHIQHPSLSEEKAKPVEPERLKLKIERYRSLEWNVLFFLSDVFIFFINVLVFSEKNKDFRNDTEQWPETGFYTYVSKWTSIYIRQILHFGKKGWTSFIKFLMPLYSSIFQQFLSLFTT